MTKRIVIAGCRNYNNYTEAKACIDIYISEIKNKYILVFLSGCCSGADSLGERYAAEHGYIMERYPALWKKYGKSAGPLRNKKMAEKADYVIYFWDGKSPGTKSMIFQAMYYNKQVKIKYIDI